MAYWLRDLKMCEKCRKRRPTVEVMGPSGESCQVVLCKLCGEAMLRELAEDESRRIANAAPTT